MNNRQKEVMQNQLDSEKAILKELEKQYKKALDDIDTKIRILESDELTQSRIYRIEYQKALKQQVEAILEKLHSDEYSTIQQFLSNSYTDGFLGTVYDMHGQGVPLIFPIDPKEAVAAVMTESKLSVPLYESLGIDTKKLSETISSEISRGIASNMAYTEIARNIANASKAPLGRAKTIVQTEAHRIQEKAALDAQYKAKSRGADVVKQWNSTLDGDTRPTHRKLDGQIREVEKPFEANGQEAMYPGGFGDPAEDCNCRCRSLTRAKWALDEEELQTLRNRAEFFGLDKINNFEDFKTNYLSVNKREAETIKGIGLQYFALDKATNARMSAEFKKALDNGDVNLNIRRQKQNEHIAGTKEREKRIANDGETNRMSSYFYEGTDIPELVTGLFGTGKMQFTSEHSEFPVEYISLEKPIGMVYNVGEQKYVPVTRIAIVYGKNGIHAYPVKDW